MGEFFRISLVDVWVLGQFGEAELQRKRTVSECAVIREESPAGAGARVCT
jgi:hypothetical protein